MVQHQKQKGVKRKQFDAKSPVFIQFRDLKQRIGKNSRRKIRFVHTCCIDSHIVYRAAAGSARPWTHKNRGKVAHGDSSAAHGLFFLTQTLCINSAEVVQSLAVKVLADALIASSSQIYAEVDTGNPANAGVDAAIIMQS